MISRNSVLTYIIIYIVKYMRKNILRTNWENIRELIV